MLQNGILFRNVCLLGGRLGWRSRSRIMVLGLSAVPSGFPVLFAQCLMFASEIGQSRLQLFARLSERLLSCGQFAPSAKLCDQNSRVGRGRSPGILSRSSNAFFFMVKRFMLLFQFLDLAAGIAAGADKLLPQCFQ